MHIIDAFIGWLASKKGLVLLPFFLATSEKSHINSTRLIEAILIAGITAGVTIYGTTRALESKVDEALKSITQRMDRNENRAIRIDERLQQIGERVSVIEAKGSANNHR